MRRYYHYLLLWLSVPGLCACSANSLEGDIEALKVLGTETFSTVSWQQASSAKRVGMVYSFLKQHDIKQLNAQQMITLLGKPTAYYEYDEFPAYRIGPEHIESSYGSGFLLAFPVDRKSGLVQTFILIPHPKDLALP